jgi:hypothetical protein
VRATSFELAKNVAQLVVGPEHVDAAAKDFDKVGDPGFVFGVDEN